MDTSPPRRLPTRQAGTIALCAASFSLIVLVVPGHVAVFHDHWASLYGPGHWALCAVLAGSGLALRIARPAVAGVAATAGALAAGQLAATGVWAVRHWEPFTGMGGAGESILGILRPLAVGLAVAGATAAAACVLALRAAGAWDPAASGPRRLAPVAIGALLSVGLPILLLGGLTPITLLGTYGLLFGLPWGAAVAATGLLRRDAAITAGAMATVGPLAVTGWNAAWELGYGLGWQPYMTLLPAVALVAAATAALAVRRVRPTGPAEASTAPLT
ncbi:hypothetical protein [Catellatospora sp. NPDC049609]|uniref:hypothetical protein n=1 Tax=Catellatospora sp. NPDC049609 TaxID=3155505 RepID=UPI00343E2B50